MNEDMKEYAEEINGSKMKKTNDLENGQDSEKNKNFEEKCKKSFYQHRSNFNERNDANCKNSVLRLERNNLNCSGSCDTTSPRNGNCQTYRNTYSSSSEDEDEYCVYTYKGAEVASNLPESFFNLGVDVQNGREGSLCSSPEMDYLEMDFDPTANGQDSDSDNVSPVLESALNGAEKCLEPVVCDENANCYEKPVNVEAHEEEETIQAQNDELFNFDYQQPCCSKSLPSIESPVESVFRDNRLPLFQGYSSDSSDEESPKIASRNNSFGYFKIFEGNTDSCSAIFITDGFRDDNQHHYRTDYSACISDTNDIKEHFNCFDGLLPIDPAYSISAVVNVLTALHIPHDSLSVNQKLSELLHNRRTRKNTSLIDYLSIRSVENVNEAELSHFLNLSTDFGVHSRFFTTYPRRNINLLEWLSNWIKKGAVPVVTRNVQNRGRILVKNIISNPWRHNVIYRIESSNIHLTNPIERVPESTLGRQLCQPPLIYIKKSSLMKRWNPQLDLRPLLRPKDQRWYKENVLGQLATIIREQTADFKTNHCVRIPSNCRCGITIIVPKNNRKLCEEVDKATELPLAISS